MTKKDYIAIAAALKDAKEKALAATPLALRAHVSSGCEVSALAIANVMQKDNPSFNRELFLKAAGVL